MIIDGKKLAAGLLSDLAKEFAFKKGLTVAAIVAGDNPAALSFIKQKEKIAWLLGIELMILNLSETADESDFISEIKKLNIDDNISGIIVQLPLPGHIPADKILSFIAPNKDIDALGPSPLVLAPAVKVCQFIFEKYNIDLVDKKIVVAGQGRLVGKPVADWLASQNIRAFVINRDTLEDEKESLIREADVLISGVGQAGLIQANWIKGGAAVIDFGCDFKDGKIAGDIAPQAGERAGLFTPTPGGTGPILSCFIFDNLLCLTI
ncbi:MAG: bifunctional 5,10-methylenetetrahydrofolate dehydrogenase/5,10-methenyltetrahydrofolate cyclohydrolase [Patescibacteria group bacterium]